MQEVNDMLKRIADELDTAQTARSMTSAVEGIGRAKAVLGQFRSLVGSWSNEPLKAERDAARKEARQAHAARDAARKQAVVALAERDEAVRTAQAATAAREQAEAERDEAVRRELAAVDGELKAREALDALASEAPAER